MESPDPNISTQRWKQMFDRVFPQPKGVKQSDPSPSPANYEEAVKWAETHSVSITGSVLRQPKVDLSLAPEALPVVAELVASNDDALVTTALIALAFNGVKVESDATEVTDPTYSRFTFTDGTVRTIPRVTQS
ncbi:MAG TPA: hypothetical protein VNC61_03255 [Acidimicrobiales bacterium]|nr:hypothetical protein [Acidimicrobiales bacterium]